MSVKENPRLKDSRRNTSLWSQFLRVHGGETTAFWEAICDRLPDVTHEFIGDDLTSKELDGYWDHFCNGNKQSAISDWLDDKPHQVHYRMINRLTRVEEELRLLKLEMAQLKTTESE